MAKLINLFSAGIDFRRLKSKAVWNKILYYSGRRPHNIGVQLKKKELTKTFRMISNLKKTFWFHGLYENISALEGLISEAIN